MRRRRRAASAAAWLIALWGAAAPTGAAPAGFEAGAELAAGRPFGSGTAAYDTGPAVAVKYAVTVRDDLALAARAALWVLRLDDSEGVDGSGHTTLVAAVLEYHPLGSRGRWRPYLGPLVGAGRTALLARYGRATIRNRSWGWHAGLEFGGLVPVGDAAWVGPAAVVSKAFEVRECTDLEDGAVTACTDDPELRANFVYFAGLSLRWIP